MALYLAKASSQAAWPSGGMTPATGFHSVMESPDSVRRVAPPTTTIRKTSAATLHNQSETAPERPRTWAATT